jgi:lysozyme
MKVSPAGAKFIKSFEGCKLHAYQDLGHVWTIGYGATGEGVAKGTVWTQDDADERFLKDLESREQSLTKLIGDTPTEPCEFDAMLSLAYNIGMGAFKASTLLKEHKAKHKSRAAAQFLNWNKVRGVVVMGLVRRRIAERLMYLGE